MTKICPYSTTNSADFDSMAFKRSFEEYLKRWKLSSTRKPLILRGARQVGKTTLIREFAQTYTHAIVLNLEKPADRRYFDDFDDV